MFVRIKKELDFGSTMLEEAKYAIIFFFLVNMHIEYGVFLQKRKTRLNLCNNECYWSGHPINFGGWPGHQDSLYGKSLQTVYVQDVWGQHSCWLPFSLTLELFFFRKDSKNKMLRIVLLVLNSCTTLHFFYFLFSPSNMH